LKDRLKKKGAYLDKHVFYGLTNLNDGFDAMSIKYFSETDFKIVLDRVKEFGIGITGIEPWKDGEFYDVMIYEMVTNNPADPEWYLKAFEDFKKDDKNLQYAASYSVSDKQLKKILWPIIAKINTQPT